MRHIGTVFSNENRTGAVDIVLNLLHVLKEPQEVCLHQHVLDRYFLFLRTLLNGDTKGSSHVRLPVLKRYCMLFQFFQKHVHNMAVNTQLWDLIYWGVNDSQEILYSNGSHAVDTSYMYLGLTKTVKEFAIMFSLLNQNVFSKSYRYRTIRRVKISS